MHNVEHETRWAAIALFQVCDQYDVTGN